MELGIGPDTKKWNCKFHKKNEAICKKPSTDFFEKKTCSPLKIQVLHRNFSAFAQLSDFFMEFRFHLVSLLGKLEGVERERKLIFAELIQKRTICSIGS
jgi:hypothetical protein